MKKAISSNRGFTLVELMVGIAMLAIIITPLASLFFSSMSTASRTSELGEATRLAENISEQIEAIGFEAVRSANFEIVIDGQTYVPGRGIMSTSASLISNVPIRGGEQLSVQVELLYNGIFFSTKPTVPTRIDPNISYVQRRELSLLEISQLSAAQVAELDPELDPDAVAWAQYYASLAASEVDFTAEQYLPGAGYVHATRTMNIDLNSSNSSITFSYAFAHFPTGVPELDLIDMSTAFVHEIEVPIEHFSNSSFSTVAVYIYPWYGGGEDDIIVDSTLSTSSYLSLIRQIDATLEEDELINFERNYVGFNLLKAGNNIGGYTNISQILGYEASGSHPGRDSFSLSKTITPSNVDVIYPVKLTVFDPNNMTSSGAINPIYTLNLTLME